MSIPLTLETLLEPGWLPARLESSSAGDTVQWLDTGSKPLDAPFYQKSLAAMRRANAPEGHTSLAELLHLAEQVDAVPPTGFLFHISRCGSTMAANALRCLDHTIVVSEPQPVNAALLACGRPQPGDAQRVLEALVRVLGRRRSGSERRYFLKFTSWNCLSLPLFRTLWPEVPLVFLCRDPKEVVVSNVAKPAHWMAICRRNPRYAATLLGWRESTAAMSPEEFCARIIGQFCRAAAAMSGELLVVDYSRHGAEAVEAMLRHFHISPQRAESERIRESLRYYSKAPSGERVLFAGDQQEKQAAMSPLILEMVERWVQPHA